MARSKFFFMVSSFDLFDFVSLTAGSLRHLRAIRDGV